VQLWSKKNSFEQKNSAITSPPFLERLNHNISVVAAIAIAVVVFKATS